MTAVDIVEIETPFPKVFPDKRCYSVEDIMDILGISRPTVYNLINQKQFRSVKVGGKYRISRKSFDQWLDAQE